ncbi:TonB-dependent receptor plug domain-containing protein [Shewanella baltica]|jgi:iron complex outermembrane recepter protein|uniref:TonB-dependent receptor plug domain-containing protein n=1 Tax=Shewanella TaxID=22 RepID=UPI001CF590C6|nr:MULTISPECIES: TonB-dependent receptor [Shewanella]MCB2384161.1 TonB-dependent receptor [Shewanella sp. SR1]MCS6098873.1 TonB-dependent receptor [Shewanella baltica]MCS6155312.1 TonB-dependent receptor [Shewanella baltica]MCS6182171.1 TonB-dependent receptor [Shewanella baltica]MCS6230062.1 TonB-dependent receptor [Shewanella baltica]
MIKRTKVASAINLAIVASITSGAFVTTSVFAAEEKAKVERIEVTGSRIQRQDMETASPVTVIDAAAIKAEGFTSVDQMLQVQTSMAGAAVGSSTNNGADGVAQVDLRGMGSQRTLVLLNGRRMVNSGSGADSSVDLNSIPVAMIARVEILKDGASAVYGSDAIAGVVNIITKKDFEGFQLDFNGSGTDKGDGRNGDVSALYGFNTDGGNYTFGAAYSDRRGVIQSDRSWTKPGSSSFVPNGGLVGNVLDENGQPVLDEDGVNEKEVKINQGQNWSPLENGYNFTQDSFYQTPSERRSLFANMTQELGNDVVLTADALYTNRRSNQQLAPQPADIMLDVCGPDVDPAKCVTLDNSMAAAGIVADDGMVNYRRRMNDVGPRIYSQDTDTWRLSAGLAGSLDVHTGMNWDVTYTYGKNQAKTAVANSINAKDVANSIYADQDAWFSGAELSKQIGNDVSYTEMANGGNEQQTLSAGLNGELFDLKAGAVGFAIGAEYRRESGFYNPDPIVVAGESTASQQDPTDGNYNVISIFQEVSVPFTEKLTGEFALRLDDYSTFGKATTWKIGLTYAATDDLMVRGVAATGFRAPSVSELYGGNSGSFDYLKDPWGKELDEQIEVNRISDADLKPEESESFTAGLVYSPSYIDGMSVTLDYWRFKVTNAIARANTQDGLDACYAGDTAACDQFNIGAGGDLTNLSNALTNVGTQDTSGIDFNLAYNFELIGLDWKVNNDTTYLVDFEQDGQTYTGTIDGNFGAYARVRNNFSLSAGQDDWSVMYFNRYIGGMTDLAKGYDVDSVLYHNISGTYHINDMTTVSLGVKNFTDEEPSRVSNGSDGGTVPEVYDTIGRVIYGGVTVKF